MIDITLPIKPLSVNACWKGKRYKTKEAKIYDTLLQFSLPKVKLDAEFYEVHYKFHIKTFKSSDIDNMIKVLQDNLVKKGIIKDDRYIVKLIVEKLPAKDDKIEIKIMEWTNGTEKNGKRSICEIV